MQTMKHVLMNTKDNEGIADFVPAVGKAVEQLDGRPECHKVIVIFTDAEGGRDISVSLFNHKKVLLPVCVCVVVFPFSVFHAV